MARILYFGRLADITGCSEEDISIPLEITDTIALRHWLDTHKRAGGALLEPTVRLAINDAFAVDPAPVTDRDEIAFMPPVGGG